MCSFLNNLFGLISSITVGNNPKKISVTELGERFLWLRIKVFLVLMDSVS